MQKGRIFAMNNLKPFGKMTVLIFVALLFLFVGEWGISLILLLLIILAKIANVSKEEGEYANWKTGLGPKPKKRK